jgi:hypothetical protein
MAKSGSGLSMSDISRARLPGAIHNRLPADPPDIQPAHLILGRDLPKNAELLGSGT